MVVRRTNPGLVCDLCGGGKEDEAEVGGDNEGGGTGAGAGAGAGVGVRAGTGEEGGGGNEELFVEMLLLRRSLSDECKFPM